MKAGSSASANVTLTLYQGGSTAGSVLASVTHDSSSFTGQFNPVAFDFSSVQSLGTGNYYVTLTSTAPNVQSQAYFIKGADGAIISLDGTTAISPTIATVSAAPSNSNLTLSKAAPASVLANGAMTYTINLGNDGGSSSGTSTTVKDQLPAGVKATAAAASTGVSSVSCTPLNTASALLTCSVTLSSALASAVPPGTAAFTIAATAPSTGGSITNYASVDPSGGNSPATPGASCTTTSCGSASTTVTAPSNVTLSMSGSPSTVLTNGVLTYTLGLGNSGGATSGTSLTVKNQLPAGVTASAAAGVTGVSSVVCSNLNSAGALLTCTVTLSSGLAASAPNGTGSFTITATAPSTAGSITNYASVDPTGGSSPATPGSSCSTTSCASAATTVNTPANITMAKSAAATVLTNGTLTYTFGLGNSGGTTSGTSVTVADQLPAGMKATAAAGVTGVSSVVCSNLNSAGALLTCTVTLSSGLAASAPNGTGSFTITATAPSTAGSITNYASVDPTGGSSPATPGSSCSTTSCASAATTVNTPTNITMAKSAAATVLTNGTLTYTIGLGNSGGTASGTSVTVADQLPAGMTATAAAGVTGVSSVVCSNLNSAGALLTCTVTLSSGLAASAPNGTGSFTITATAPSTAGSITNYASVDPTGGSSPATPGSSCSTTSCASASTTVNAASSPTNITISKSGTSSVLTNGSLTYTIGLGNSGGTTSGTSATVSDQLPAGMKATAATAGTGVSSVSCTNLNSAGALLACTVTLNAGLAPSATNGTAAFTITATAPSTAGSVTNYASVDPTGSNSPATPGSSCSTTSCASAATTVSTPTNITMSKSAASTVLTSGALTYTIGLGNSGGTASGTSATISDQLPAGMTATAATAGTGVSLVSCTNLNTAGALLTCTVTLAGGLAAGAPNATASFTIATTAPSSPGSITNYASVDPAGGNSPATPGSSCSTTSCASAATTVNPISTPANFTISKSGAATALTNGSLTYTLGLGNSGQTTSGTSATINDKLPAGVSATAATAGTGVSSVSCTNLNSAGALLACSVTLSGGLAGSAPNGTATFTMTTTAPSTAGSITNYASVDPAGGNSPATPGSSCSTTSCASASTTVKTPTNITMSKSAAASVLTNGALTYTMGLGNSGGTPSATTATVKDQLPAGMKATAATAGTGVSTVSCTNLNVSGALLTCTVTLGTELPANAPNGTASFTISATAPSSAGAITNYASVDPTGGNSPAVPGSSCSTSSCASAATTVNAPSSLTMSKSGAATAQTGDTLTYTIGLGNNGGTVSGTAATVRDQLPAGMTATAANNGAGVSAVSCTNLNAAGALLTCTVTLSSGLPVGAPNGSAGFTIIAKAPSSAGTITNYASIDSTGGDSPPTPGAGCVGSCASATTAISVPSSPVSPPPPPSPARLTLAKTVDASSLVRGTNATFNLVVSNSGGGTSGEVMVSDNLPAGLTPKGTSGSGWNCSISGQAVSCTRQDSLGGGSSYPAIAITAAVAANAPASITNAATVSGGGASDSSDASVTATVTGGPDLRIVKSHQGAIRAGQSGVTYSIGVTNIGTAVTFGTVTVTDALPAGMTLVSMAGAGWNCSPATASCVRSDELAANAVYPAVLVTVNVPATANGPISNSARVSGGGDVNSANNSASDTATVVTSDLTVVVSGPSSMLQGQGATYTLNVSNVGTAATLGATSVVLELTNGVTPTNATGDGWSCAIEGQKLTCSRSDVLQNGGAGYPPISVGVTIGDSVNAGNLLANVSGGGDGNPANNSSSLALQIAQQPFDLTIALTHSGALAQGGPSSYQIVVTNIGPGKTAGTVTVSDAMPDDLSPTAAAGAGWNCIVSDRTVTCTRVDSLTGGSSYPPISIAVNVSESAPTALVNTAIVRNDADARMDNNTASDNAPVTQIPPPDLRLAKTHVGDFVRGQLQAAFSLVVSNGGGSPTKDAVTVTDDVPAGLTPKSATGTGWTCQITGQTVSCSRTDALAAGAEYPAIGITVAVATNAPDSITNTASVAGGGDRSTGNNSAGDTVKVITLTSVDMNVTKTVDKPLLTVGDTAVFTVGLTNPSGIILSEVNLVDTVPPGFIYVNDTATLEFIPQTTVPGGKTIRAAGKPSSPQSIKPVVENGRLSFSVGTLEPDVLAQIRYKTVVSSAARAGEFQTQVIGSANSPLGQRVSTVPVRVRVVVTMSAFTFTQMMIGRVFEDSNGNGVYDSGERGVPNVRIVTASGQSVTTDAAGQFNLPSLAAGTTMVAIDPATIPAGLALPTNTTRLSGGSQLIRTPLEGGSMLRQNFPLVRTTTAVGAEQASQLSPAAPASGSVTQQPATRLRIVAERSSMFAGGRDKQLIRIRALDDQGNPAGKTTIAISTRLGMMVPVPSSGTSCDAAFSSESRPELSRQFTTETSAGEAAVCLISDANPGLTHLVANAGTEDALQATVDVRFETEERPPVLVAVGELGIGLSNPKDGSETPKRADGAATIFFQDSLTKKDALTVAVRTKEGVNNATGTDGMFDLDPTQRIYPLMGDSSTRMELAQSTGRVFARYDRGHSYAMFGDLHGDAATPDRSGILDFSRNVTGARFQIEAAPKTWIQGQIAQPRTAFMREILTTETGSAIRLSRTQIVRASETISLEVRDRRNPAVVLSRQTLVRNVDYSLDVRSGVLYLTQMVPLFDRDLNLVQIVCTYEYQTTGLNSMTYLGRGSKAFGSSGLRIGASFLEQHESGTDFKVGGADLEQKLFRDGSFKVEVPVSSGLLPSDIDPFGMPGGSCCQGARSHNGTAVRAELQQPVGFYGTVVRGRFSSTDEHFLNPYGVATVPGQRTGGLSVETHPFETTQVSFGFDGERNQNDLVDNQRKTFGAKVSQSLGKGFVAKSGLDVRQFDDFKSNRSVDSDLVSAGLLWKPVRRFEASVNREQNLADADPTYPNQTLLGGQFQMSPSNRLYATQRFSSAPIMPISGVETVGLSTPLSTRETAFGIESRVAQHTSLSTRYRLDSSSNGTDSFAVFGVLTRVPLREKLSMDWSVDDAMHLAGQSASYFGGGIGLAYTDQNRLRSSFRYELRQRQVTEHMLSAGAVGRLTSTISTLGRYRIADIGNGVRGTDGQAALALRPRQSDKVAMLFSYEHGLTNATPLLPNVKNDRRTDRVSADGLWQIAPKTEFYARLGMALIPESSGGRRSATLLQGRLQQSLTRRFDVAGESRIIRESVIEPFRAVTAGEFGAWLTRDIRVGLGYSTRGYKNPGSLLNSTASRGGTYLVITSRLSALFDLMGTNP